MVLGPVMLDLEGPVLTPADRALLAQPAVGGVILFSRNYRSPSQLADLVAAIRAVRSPPLLVAVDQEGGTVQRFRDGFTAIPPMRRLGREYDRDPEEALSLARLAGWLVASELRAAGVDFSFAPCADLDRGLSEVIGERAFHRDPLAVAELASAFCRGLRSAGMVAIAKHYPGHGGVAADSHLALPVDRREYGELLDDMLPFDKLAERRLIAGVMPAHVVYAEVDALPAGFSPYWIGTELRGRTGFDGAVISDDLSMKATASYGSMPERARRALAAGCDLVLVCNDRPAAAAAVAALAEWSNPPSLVRLARLHGTGQVLRETLLASDEWQAAADTLAHWLERPSLKLDS